MTTFLFRATLRGLPWSFGVAAAIVFGTFFAASLRSNTGFEVMLQSIRLLFPTAGLQPPMPLSGEWLLSISYWVATAACVGVVVRVGGAIRKVLLTILVVAILGSILQLALWAVGYRFLLRLEM
jgi:hypothetical protein